MSNFQHRKLIKLIEYHQKAPDRKFSMGLTRSKTHTCAAGALPEAFPDDWHQLPHTLLLTKGSTGHETGDVMKFFGATDLEISHLFTVDGQTCSLFGGRTLHGSTTRKQWITHAQQFLEKIGCKATA